MLYMYTLIPQGAEIKLLFALRQVVFKIEPIFTCAILTWPWRNLERSNANFAAQMLYMYTLIPKRAQIKLLFALLQAVFEIEPIFTCATSTWPWHDLERSNVILAAYMLYMYTLLPQRPKLSSFFALRQAVYEREPIFINATLTWPWKVKCDFGSIDALYAYTYTPRGWN